MGTLIRTLHHLHLFLRGSEFPSRTSQTFHSSLGRSGLPIDSHSNPQRRNENIVPVLGAEMLDVRADVQRPRVTTHAPTVVSQSTRDESQSIQLFRVPRRSLDDQSVVCRSERINISMFMLRLSMRGKDSTDRTCGILAAQIFVGQQFSRTEPAGTSDNIGTRYKLAVKT